MSTMIRPTWRAVLLAALLAMVVITSAASAQHAANVAPADAGVYIELPNLAEWRAEFAGDPLVQLLKQQMPHHRQPQAWQHVQEAMRLSGEEIFQRYFGRMVVIIAEHPGEKPPGVLMSQIDDADAALAIERLHLTRVNEAAAFTTYRTSDGRGLFAFGPSWMIMSDARHRDYLQRIIEQIGKKESLADDPQFRQWVARVPEEAQALLFSRGPTKDEAHVMWAVRSPAALSLHYAGKAPQWKQLLEIVVQPQATLSYGPAPQNTVAAVALNVRDHTPDPQLTRFVDRLLGGRSFERDVLPKLGAPATLLIGRMDGGALQPPIAPPAPVLALSLPMADASVEADLNRIMDSLMVLFNLGTMEWKTPPAAMRSEKHEGASYRVAELGPALAQRGGVPEYAGLAQLTWGRIGDRFVLATQEGFFRAMVDASRTPAEAAAFTALQQDGGAGAAQPIAGAFIETTEFGRMLAAWIEQLTTRHPGLARQAEGDRPLGRAVRQAMLAAELMQQYGGAGAYLRQAADGTVEGHMTIRRAAK